MKSLFRRASAVLAFLASVPAIAQVPLAAVNPSNSGLPSAVTFSNNEWIEFKQDGRKVTAPVPIVIDQVAQQRLRPRDGVIVTQHSAVPHVTAAPTQLMTRAAGFTREATTTLHSIWPNFRVLTSSSTPAGTGQEVGSGGPVTINASIEYPAGTICGSYTFNGAASGTAPDGGTVTGDVNCVMPAGAAFFIRTRAVWSGSGQILYWQQPNNVVSGEGVENGTAGSPVTDKTGNAASITASGGSMYGPLITYGRTSRPTVCIFGDSRAVGVGDSMDAANAVGPQSRALDAALVPHANLSVAANQLQWFMANSSTSSLLPIAQQYCSNILLSLGVNDARGGGRTAAQIQASAVAFAGLFPTKRVFAETVSPYTTSSNGWADRAGQSTTSGAAAIVGYNTWLRTAPANFASVFDTGGVMEDGFNTGYLKSTGTANGYTTDGLHLNAAANTLIKNSGAYDVSVFGR